MATTRLAAQAEPRRFTVNEYERMGEAGILREDDRLELIGGEIVRMAAMGARHAACVRRLTRLLVRALGEAASVSIQLPVAIPDYDEPEPDIAVLHPREDEYEHRHPTPADVLLLVEVADTSLAYDRAVKLPLYARAGIPEAWLVDLPGEVVERHTEPSRDGYRQVTRFERGETLESTVLPSLVLAVSDVLR